MKRLLMVGVVLGALLPTTAFAHGRGVVFVGPASAPYGFYGPYPYGPYAVAPKAGEVKLDTKVKDADIYVNGSYAGNIRQLKTMMMRPGSYDIGIRAPGRTPFDEQVFVVAGKTLDLHPELRVQALSAPAVP
jgi:PEGA domain